LIAFLLQIDISFQPAFAFPGESVAVTTNVPADVSAEGVRMTKSGAGWQLVAPDKPT
jgi:hypothetical protein